MKNTILFGNGINRLSPLNISWDELLVQIKESRVFKNGHLPNTMIYERVILEKPSPFFKIEESEFNTKEKIAELLKEIHPNKYYQKLFHFNASYYLTTNYDYGFIKTLTEFEKITPEDLSTEAIYSLRREYRINYTSESNNLNYKHLWHMHGEISKPATIMLGLDHYCGSIAKIDSYIKGGYEHIVNGESKREDSIQKKFYENRFNFSSWIDLFFVTNVHIIGFSFDYSEIDLWWILNKRARLKRGKLNDNIVNKIYFYCDTISQEKRGLLESLSVEVIEIPLSNSIDKYEEYYSNLMPVLHKMITNYTYVN